MTPVDLSAEVDAVLGSVKSEEMRARLRERLTTAVDLELERAAGVDVSLGEQALKASLTSISAEYAMLIEINAARVAAKVLFSLIAKL